MPIVKSPPHVAQAIVDFAAKNQNLVLKTGKMVQTGRGHRVQLDSVFIGEYSGGVSSDRLAYYREYPGDYATVLACIEKAAIFNIDFEHSESELASITIYKDGVTLEMDSSSFIPTASYEAIRQLANTLNALALENKLEIITGSGVVVTTTEPVIEQPVIAQPAVDISAAKPIEKTNPQVAEQTIQPIEEAINDAFNKEFSIKSLLKQKKSLGQDGKLVFGDLFVADYRSFTRAFEDALGDMAGISCFQSGIERYGFLALTFSLSGRKELDKFFENPQAISDLILKTKEKFRERVLRYIDRVESEYRKRPEPYPQVLSTYIEQIQKVWGNAKHPSASGSDLLKLAKQIDKLCDDIKKEVEVITNSANTALPSLKI